MVDNCDPVMDEAASEDWIAVVDNCDPVMDDWKVVVSTDDA